MPVCSDTCDLFFITSKRDIMNYNSRISECEQATGETLQSAQKWATEVVEAQPLASICTVFAAGFVVGVSAVAALATTASGPKSRFSQMEQLTQRISDAVASAIPHQLSEMWNR